MVGNTEGQTFDSAGNRAVVSNGGGQKSTIPASSYTPVNTNAFDAANHWINASHDNAGNVLAFGTETMTWDAEERLTGLTDTSNTTPATVAYTYDGDGRRVMKASGGLTTTFVYDPLG